MRTVPLAEIASVTSGITKGRRTSGPTKPVPYLAVSNVQAGHLQMDVVKEIEATPSEIERYALEGGDLVLTEGGDPDKLGRGTVWRRELPLCLHQNHIFRVRLTNGKVFPDYLARYMASSQARSYFLRSAKQTTGIASINMTQLKAMPVAVPQLEEQYRIAAILDHADAIRAKRRQILSHLDTLTQSIFHDMFGRFHEWSWPTARVDHVGRVQLGRQRAPKYQTGQWSRPYMRVANVQLDRLDLSDVLSMDFDPSDYATYRLEPGDILLNEGQNTELVGRPAIWRGELEGCCFQNTLLRFQPDWREIAPEFALHVFIEFLRTGQFARVSSKTSNMAHLGRSRFAAMQIPLPPIERQREFARRAEQVTAQRGVVQKGLAADDALFASLQSRAFRGEL